MKLAVAAAAVLAALAASSARAAPGVVDFASLACGSYETCARPLPAGWQSIAHVHSAPHTAFQASAFWSAATSELVVSYAGTKPSDSPDIAADKALAKMATMLGVLSRETPWHKGEAEAQKQNWVPDTRSDRYSYQVLASKLHQAEEFLAASITLARSRAGGKPFTVYVTGHSLGGFIAQVVGSRHALPTHTFNPGPAGKLVLHFDKARVDDSRVTNHRRLADTVSLLVETMVGRHCNYPDSGRDPVSAHSIANFIDDLRKGIKAKGC